MILFFDTETTGVDEFSDEVVQLGMKLTKHNGGELETWCELIIPSGEIPSESTKIHGITTEMAKSKGVPFKEAADKFAKFVLQADLIVAHNMEFDHGFMIESIDAENLNHLLPIITDFKTKNWFCTMKATTDFCQLPGFRGYKWPKLSELHQKLFGEGFQGAHDAMNDVNATSKCFFELCSRGIINQYQLIKKL